jgi:hypothetical protein
MYEEAVPKSRGKYKVLEGEVAEKVRNFTESLTQTPAQF